jgi:hypothetical protein
MDTPDVLARDPAAGVEAARALAGWLLARHRQGVDMPPEARRLAVLALKGETRPCEEVTRAALRRLEGGAGVESAAGGVPRG